MPNTANAIQKAANSNLPEEKKKKTFRDIVEERKSEIAKALPSVITPERFTRITLSALTNTPRLQECTPSSFLGAMMTAAQLGLEPNTPLGQAYLIPFRNKGVLECEFQLGYRGIIDLAYRSGEVTIIQAQTVYENDIFEYSFGLNPELKHVPARSERGNPIFFYAMFRTKDGGYGFDVMSVDDVRKHAQKYSKAYSSGPWQTNFEEMAKKTVLKKILKYAPLKSDFVRGIAADETIKTDLSEDMYAVPSEEIEIEDVDEVIDGETGEVSQTTI